MVRSLSDGQQGAIFYALTLAMAGAVALFGPRDGDLLQVLTMLTPALGVLVMMLVLTPDGYRRAGWARLGLHRVGWRGWPIALAAPTAILACSYGVAWLLGAFSWSFESDVMLTLVLNIVIISVYALPEEVGWRGYLLPRMAERPGPLAGALVGFLHGVWHLPLMLLTTAYNPAGDRLVVVPLFLAVLTAAGVLYGYLRVMSGSLWPVVIAHGTFNAVLGVLAGAVVTSDRATVAYLTGETGLFTLLATVVVALLLVGLAPRGTPGVLAARRAGGGRA